MESSGIPGLLPAQARVGIAQRRERLGGAPLVFADLAERIAHRDAIGIGDVGTVVVERELFAIFFREGPRLHVGEPAPSIAAGGIAPQRLAIMHVRFVEAAGMHERVTQQDARGNEIRRQIRDARQGIDRWRGVPLQLQVASEIEPGHGVAGRKFSRAMPTGTGCLALTAGLLCIAEVDQDQRVIRALRMRLLQRRARFGIAAAGVVHDARQPQRFGMGRRHEEHIVDPPQGIRRLALLDRLDGHLQRGDGGLRQACHARVVGMRSVRRIGLRHRNAGNRGASMIERAVNAVPYTATGQPFTRQSERSACQCDAHRGSSDREWFQM